MSSFRHPHFQEQQQQSIPFRILEQSNVPNQSHCNLSEFLQEIDFLKTTDESSSMTSPLGLRLSSSSKIDNNNNSSYGMSSATVLDVDFYRVLQGMDADVDSFLTAQSEQLRKALLDNFEQSQFQIMASLGETMSQKIREKELELQAATRRNLELEEQITKLRDELGALQQQSKHNEARIVTLRFKLQEVFTRSWNNNREGCGLSEADESSSCCNNKGAINFQLLCKEEKKYPMACKDCGLNDVCMLLLPCRHLCLCKECEVNLSFCPVCQSHKYLGVEVYM